MANSRTPALSVAIGRRIAELRRAQGVTAAAIAESARDVGMEWQPGTVCFIETARRRVFSEELIQLPAVMSAALGRDVGISELLPADAAARLVGA